jgi:hypothetical protein
LALKRLQILELQKLERKKERKKASLNNLSKFGFLFLVLLDRNDATNNFSEKKNPNKKNKNLKRKEKLFLKRIFV